MAGEGAGGRGYNDEFEWIHYLDGKKTIQNTNSYTRIKQVSMIVKVLFYLITPLQLRKWKETWKL